MAHLLAYNSILHRFHSFSFVFRHVQVSFTGTKINHEALICQCSAGPNNPAIRNCTAGRYTNVKGKYWAGNITARYPRQDNQFEDLRNTNLTFENTPFYEEYVNYTFVTAQCDNGLCSEEDWLFGSLKECNLNGIGILCGQCRKGDEHLLARPVRYISFITF